MPKRAPPFARYSAIFALYCLAIPLALLAWPMNRAGSVLSNTASWLIDLANDLI